ncbi:phospholipid transfer protein C2CD2L isoform X1 [Electrophorus electricus]|uniref:phospholipid transfer protein C2CD2L isoform X1 n=1 Tax=Electrophorus electricus TaxID=8005 RepID=UPI0015CFF877|nr:phospholipid transfer protein C2CD2L isoform X1 [Electrophorus electricus]XP_026854281.2 phospholipid transfer protein C2CD2L isoform X1 [Electrophorus electricus]
MDFQYASWLLLVALFCVSLVVVLAWLVQFSLALLRPRRGAVVQGSTEATWQLPLSLTHQTLTGGVWGSLLRLRLGRDCAGSGTQAGVKGLLSSLFAFKSFREHWQRAWVRALNEQGCRQGSSIQIAFDDRLQLPTSAAINHVTCTDQSAHSMVLQCNCSVDTVTFPVTVTQQSPAAVSMDTYQVTMEPMQAQLQVCLEEVEEEGLLVSWTFSQQPLLSMTMTPRQRVHRENSESEVDVDMIAKLVEDALYATQPAMILNLRACVSSPAFPREKPELRQNSPQQVSAVRRLLVRQLKASGVSKACQGHAGELCCVLSLDMPALEKRTRFLATSPSTVTTLDWAEDLTLDLQPETKELKIRLVERNSKGEQFLPGHACLSLDLAGRSPSGQHRLSVTPGHGLPPIATITLELQCVELNDARSAAPLHPALTPSKKVDVDRTVMPDGTIVTTVTTIQSRPKLDHKMGDSPSRSPSKVEVMEKRPTVLTENFQRRSSISPTPTPSTESSISNGLDPVAETAIRQLTESASKPVKKTPTKRSTLIISGVSKVPITEDDSPLSVGYAAAMDAALQGEHCAAGALNHHTATPHQDADETTPSDASERPSVDDVESETGSTGALETRSLKDHKVGFLRSGTKLLFRRRHKQKEPSFSQSHEDVCNLGNDSSMASCSPSSRKKGGSFSRRLIKRFSFRSSRSKGKSSTANGGTATDD